MTPGNPPIHKTVNSSSAKASLAQSMWDSTNGRSQTEPRWAYDPQWVLPMPSCLFIHHSCLWGHLRPSTGRQPGLHCGAGGAVEGEAGTLFTRPAPPCWPAEAGGGSGDSTPLYRQNLLSTIWPLGRQVPAGRRLARNLQGGRSGCRGKEGVAGGECRCRKGLLLQGACLEARQEAGTAGSLE